jgi:serine/threonine protein kinase
MPDRPAERLIANRYALAVPIGQGGMGVVWRARDTVLGREVAIKEVRLPPTIPDSERSSMRARVLREARAAARLNHPGVVTLYDVINEQGHAFIVMELISAPTLAHVVAAEGPLEPARVALIGAGVAGALAAAHAAGIVHRDVKPSNVMVLKDAARLTDFGIARVKGDPKLTSTGLIVGSPAYMAPEQATGKAAGPAADLWGLGATLYYAVEGQAPFDRDGSIATLTAVVNDEPRPTARAGELAPVIAELLSKDPEARPSAEDLRDRLERIAGGEPAAAEPRPTDTERFPEVHPPIPLGAAAAGLPVELTRPGPSGPGRQRRGQVRPDQPARPARGPKSPPHEHPTAVAPAEDGLPPEVGNGPPPVAGEAAAPVPPAAESAPEPAAESAPATAGAELAPAARPVPTPTPTSTAVAARPAPDRRPMVIGAVAVVALIAATLVVANALRNDSGDPSGSGASANTRARDPSTTAPKAATTTARSDGTTTSAPTTTGASDGAVPPGWTQVTNQAGAYSFAYPPGWRISSRSSGLNTIQVSGPGGSLFKAQSSSHPSDPMKAWKEQERAFRARPGYVKIRLEAGTYMGLEAAVWEFTQLGGGQRVHKLDITFKSADGRWGYAVLLQSPETSWSRTARLSGQFESGFTPTG